MLLPTARSHAQEQRAFTYGPVFDRFGQTAPVATTAPIPSDARFAVAFDVSERSGGRTARTRGSLAPRRLINMHARAGVPAEATRVAVVVHGQATLDLLERAFLRRPLRRRRQSRTRPLLRVADGRMACG